MAGRGAKHRSRTARPPQLEAPPARPPARIVALDVWRHLTPLVPLYFGQGSIPAYLLLTAFDLALGLVLIVGTTREKTDPTTVDPRATWLSMRVTAVLILAVFFGIVAAILTIPLGMPALLLGAGSGVDWRTVVTEPSFLGSVVTMCLAAAARAQHRFEAMTTPGEVGTSAHAAPVVGDLEGDRRRSRTAYAAQTTLIATFVALSYAVGLLGGIGLVVLPALYALALIVFDARPDVAARLLPELRRANA